eukprot:5425342-Amphidinium_carterae.1
MEAPKIPTTSAALEPLVQHKIPTTSAALEPLVHVAATLPLVPAPGASVVNTAADGDAAVELGDPAPSDSRPPGQVHVPGGGGEEDDMEMVPGSNGQREETHSRMSRKWRRSTGGPRDCKNQQGKKKVDAKAKLEPAAPSQPSCGSQRLIRTCDILYDAQPLLNKHLASPNLATSGCGVATMGRGFRSPLDVAGARL